MQVNDLCHATALSLVFCRRSSRMALRLVRRGRSLLRIHSETHADTGVSSAKVNLLRGRCERDTLQLQPDTRTFLTYNKTRSTRWRQQRDPPASGFRPRGLKGFSSFVADAQFGGFHICFETLLIALLFIIITCPVQ